MEKPFVLLADDNDATCTLITALLQSEFVVDVVTDGAEAIEKLKSREYSAILLDLLMPLVDGYAVLDYLTEHRPDTLSHVLVVTASLSSAQMKRVREYDICCVISKPFDVETLQTAVRLAAGNLETPLLRGPLVSGGMILLLGELLKKF
ncbi:MAG TPA: response regulator [Thermoanaerobaculia bacterium]|nr:response regulator [Thermoanaerobaculia bacterium]